VILKYSDLGKVSWRNHERDDEDSRKNWRKFNRHGQPEEFSREEWESKGKKPKRKDHR